MRTGLIPTAGKPFNKSGEDSIRTKAESEIKAANKRAQDAEDAVKNIPKRIVLAPLTRRNFRLSKRWGREAVLSKVSGDSRAFTFTVTAKGNGVGMQPTVEISYPDSASRSSHARLCIQTGGSGNVTDTKWEASREAMMATYLGLPWTGHTYTISCN